MTHEPPADVEFSVDHDLDEDALTMHVEVEGEPAAMLHCNLRHWFWNADPDGSLANLRIDPMPADPDKAEWIFRPAINLRFLKPHQYNERQAPRSLDAP